MQIDDAISGSLWRELQKELLTFVREVPPAALDWRWASNEWSIADQIAHIAEVRDWWLWTNVLGNPRKDWYVHERENAPPTRTVAADTDALLALLAQSFEVVETCLALPAADLERSVEVIGRTVTRTKTVGWMVPHTLEHDSHHQGQATLLRRLYLAQAG